MDEVKENIGNTVWTQNEYENRWNQIERMMKPKKGTRRRKQNTKTEVEKEGTKEILKRRI